MSVINTNIFVLSRNKTISILSLKNNFMLNEINVRIAEKFKKINDIILKILNTTIYNTYRSNYK